VSKSPYFHVLDELDSLVAHAEILAMRDELKPYHDEKCQCRLCIRDRWIRSDEAAEFARTR
jgi:hypothetical protein